MLTLFSQFNNIFISALKIIEYQIQGIHSYSSFFLVIYVEIAETIYNFWLFKTLIDIIILLFIDLLFNVA